MIGNLRRCLTRWLATGLAMAAAALGVAFAEPGSLVIVGGGLSRSNADIYRAFVDRAGDGRIVVIAAASSEPALSARSFADTLVSHGVHRDRIDVAQIATLDDPSTVGVNEGAWTRGAYQADEVAKIEAADAIWITGGDQARLIETLIDEGGGDTPALSAIRRRLSSGAVVGGTSAGAAVMSPHMIARGDSLTALIEPLGELSDTGELGERLVLTSGLGFFPSGVVDQHFGERARLGRLARAISESPGSERIGFGIDEDTALVVSLASRSATVVGRGSVTVLDGRTATFATGNARWSGEALRLHVLAHGDSVSLDGSLAVSVDPGRLLIARGEEEYDHQPPDGGGMAIPSADLATTLGVDLLDNSASRWLKRVSFGGNSMGVMYRFAEDARSHAYFGRDAEGRGRYTVSGVLFSVQPLRVVVRGSE